MSARSSQERVLKVFLSGLPQEKQERLIRFLPHAQREALATLIPHPKEEGFPSFFDLIHWSWFIPTLKTYSEREQALFLQTLEEHAREGLRHELQIHSFSEEPLRPMSASYLRQTLLLSLIGAKEHPLPPPFLPPSPLKGLLRLSKKALILLIDFLSLRDLALEIRQIVETKILKKIYSFLSEDQRKFLKECLTHKEPSPWPKIGLDKWDGEEESLRHLLHRRGLARLGTALSGQDPDLVWYICHQLDIGRGNALFKLYAKEATPGLSESCIRQIEELLKHLKLL